MKLKKFFVFTFSLILFIFLYINPVCYADTDHPDISADAAYVIDNATNKVLYSKNENKRLYPASTTKILTAIIVLENCNLNDVVTASYNAVMSIPEGYSTANIGIGEQLTVEQLLELLLVHSANDAGNVLAEHTGGSIESFVSMMNTKLNDLNLTNTHFTNTYGLHDENHYTTAHDLAFIFKYCLKNETFRKLAGKASCTIPSTNVSGPRKYVSTNELLVPESNNYYKYLTAGKTGFTSQAKECLVSSAYRNDLEFISCILGSNSRFSDTRNLFEYAFSNFSMKSIVNENDVATTVEVKNAKYDSKNLDLLVDKNVTALMNNDLSLDTISPNISLSDNISAPIEEGDVLGEISYTIDGINYKANLIASHSVEKSKLVLYILYVVLGLAILVLLYRLFFRNRR